MLSLKTTANIEVAEKLHSENKESTQEQKHDQPKKETAEIRAPTREELEANIKMREKQNEVKEVEKIYHNIQKKAIEEQDKK